MSKIQEIFEDLMSRFIINVPPSEIETTDRICFQIEQAHWYYEDFIRESEPSLPGYTLKKFAEQMFQRCPLLKDFLKHSSMEEIYKGFVAYKLNVPVCGAIILNTKLDKILLVKGFGARSSWTFPKGKINQDESEVNCAIREVSEEIGFDIKPLLNEADYVEILLRGEQRNRLFIIPNVSLSTLFQPQTRNEIGDIRWHNVSDLPRYGGQGKGENDSKFYMIKAFMGYKKTRKRRKTLDQIPASASSLPKSLDGNASVNLKAMLGIGHLDSESSSSSVISFTATPPRPTTAASSSIQFTPTPSILLDSKQSSLLSILKGIPSSSQLTPANTTTPQLGSSPPSSSSSSILLPQRPATIAVGPSTTISPSPLSTTPSTTSTLLKNNSELLDILKGRTTTTVTATTTVTEPSVGAKSTAAGGSTNESEHLKSLVGIGSSYSADDVLNYQKQQATKDRKQPQKGDKQDVKILGYSDGSGRRKSAGPRLEKNKNGEQNKNGKHANGADQKKISILKRLPESQILTNSTDVALAEDKIVTDHAETPVGVEEQPRENMADFRFNVTDIMKLFSRP